MTDREAVAAIEDRIREAYAKGDADGVAAQYTEDAMLMGPGKPATVGRKAIADNFRPFFANFRGELAQEIEEIEVFGDQAYMRGRIRIQITAKHGSAKAQFQGKYIAIARRDTDGVWRFARDIYNYDHPTPTKVSILGWLVGLFRRG
jgi:uncharacterized protein (TIGR02246 family)